MESMNKKFYAGIGARKTPQDIQDRMLEIAASLESMGYTLRSGNAIGADQAFAKGVKTEAQIWLPFIGFNPGFSSRHNKHIYEVIYPDDKEAYESIAKFHPKPSSLNHNGNRLMARNYRQIIGCNGEGDSEFVIAWTPEGKEVGGTSQAIRIAKDFGIPVYNMFNYLNEDIFKAIENQHYQLDEQFS